MAAEASGREMRCRPGRFWRAGSGWTGIGTEEISPEELPASSGPEEPAGGRSSVKRPCVKPAMMDPASQPGAG
jgi:hypothetical protein